MSPKVSTARWQVETGSRVEPAAAGCSAVGPWFIDAQRSTLRVSVRVGRLVTAHGTFADVTGRVDVAANPIDSRVDVTVGTTSLSSGSACMDAMLHGAGIVDSTKNPLIAFVSHAIRPGAVAGAWLVDGLLATDSAVLDVTLEMFEPVLAADTLLFHAIGALQSGDAVQLLSQSGVERVLGRTMRLDLTVVAVPTFR